MLCVMGALDQATLLALPVLLLSYQWKTLL